MAVVLNASDVTLLRAAQRALLSVPESPDAALSPAVIEPLPASAESWVDGVAAALRPLFGTDHVYYTEPVVPPAGSLPPEPSNDSPPDHRLFAHHPLAGDAFREELEAFFTGFEEGFTQFRDVETTMIRRLVRSAGAGAFHDAPLYDARRQSQSRLHRHVFQARGIERKLALSAPLPVGEAMIVVGFDQDAAPRFEGRRHRLLELLLPAFEAGIRIRRRLQAPSLGLGATARSAPIPVVFIDTDGRERFRNAAFNALLQHLAARQDGRPSSSRPGISPDRLRSTIQELVAHVIDEASRRPAQTSLGRPGRAGKRPSPGPTSGPSDTATWSLGGFRLRASGGCTYEGTPGVLVFVETPRTVPAVGGKNDRPRHPVLPQADQVETRTPLTERQAEVALLMAEGLGDQEVAARLDISIHTARRHAGNILRKLELSSRAGIAVALLRATA